jgi:pimeloyl-ACP methyl ester carboxylesterase
MSKFLRVLTAIFIAYLLLALTVLIFQRWLVFLPTRIPAGTISQVAQEHGFLPWTNADGLIIGWKMPSSNTSQGSVLILHGNAGCALSRDYLALPIHLAEAVDVYVLEYPGYGARPGSPSRQSLDAAAEEAFALLPAQRPRYLVSESLGTGVAGDLAAAHPEAIAGLAMLAPYHDLASVAQRRFWFLPAYYLLFDRFNPAASLKHYQGPVKFVVAGDDEIIGPASGRRLFAGYGGPKELEMIPGARHNDVADQSAEWWEATFQFWRTNKR